jgi:hypothetical protein
MILSRVCCPLPLRDEAQCSRASRADRPRPSRPTSGREIQFGNSKESIIMWVEIYGRRKKKTKKQKRKLMTGIVSDSNRSAFCSSLSFVLYLGGKFKQNKKVFFFFLLLLLTTTWCCFDPVFFQGFTGWSGSWMLLISREEDGEEKREDWAGEG